jgi:hypothetical protein
VEWGSCRPRGPDDDHRGGWASIPAPGAPEPASTMQQDREHDPRPDSLESLASRGRRRRRSDRRVVELPVELELEAARVDGTARDLSAGGTLLFADERLPVRVRLRIDGRLVERTGRLVRAQTLGAGQQAYAIQFDEPLDDLLDGSLERPQDGSPDGPRGADADPAR